MLTKNKDLSKFTQGGRGVILDLFVKKENCQKSSKYGKEGGVKCFFDRCPKLFTFFFLRASLKKFWNILSCLQGFPHDHFFSSLTSSQSASILRVDSRDSSTTLFAFMLIASSSDWRSASVILCLKKLLQSPKNISRFCCEKHAVPSVTICLCVCSDLPLSSPLSTSLCSLLFALTPRLQSPGQEGLSQRSRRVRERLWV